MEAKELKRVKYGGVALLVIFFGGPGILFAPKFAGDIWSCLHPDLGVHADSVGWLPGTASDISFIKSHCFSAAEFPFTEDQFLAWMEESGREPIEITVAFSVERFLASKIVRKKLNVSNRYEDRYARIEEGLYWHTPPRGNGGGTFYAFDRQKGMAYFQHSPR